MSDLPVNVDTTYDDSASDASVKLHQQHHDAIHALYNDISGATPDLSNLGIQGELAEGAFVDGDKTKLNGIEAAADVTDAANVDAAGAVMNSDTSTAAMSFVVDEDTMSSNSATKVPTQQSVKAYVDAGASGVTVLSQVVVGAGGAADIDFSSISAGYENLRIELLARGDTASTAVAGRLRFNNDSSAIYDGTEPYSQGTTIGGVAYVAQTSAKIIEFPGSTATAGRPGSSSIRIPGYARTTFHKVGSFFGGYGPDTTSVQQVTKFGAFTWRSSAAIVRVTLIPSAGNFVEGTVATLYGESGN